MKNDYVNLTISLEKGEGKHSLYGEVRNNEVCVHSWDKDVLVDVAVRLLLWDHANDYGYDK